MLHPQALATLKQTFGYDSFRGGQQELVDAILSGQDALGIMPTGAGKSICFQLPALLLPGITLVVSPLISLMKDQVGALIQSGVRAAYINSSLSPRQVAKALANARTGLYRLIYVAPERLLTPEFLDFAQNTPISMLTVDEAHCISQWGQDFRPSYAQIPQFVAQLPQRPILSAFTATATLPVRRDILRLLALHDPLVQVAGFDRSGLYFEVQKPRSKSAALLAYLETQPGKSGIVYCSTRKAVEQVCALLQARGIAAARYHAGLPDEERRTAQDDFLFDRVRVMVATNAFGMGIDKSNVSFVVHYNMPRDLESYYQEAGRAGRDGSAADCLLLYSGQDVRTAQWMIDNSDAAYPDEETEQLLKDRDRERLRQMTFYSTTKKCLRGFILRYFGEQPPERCGNCSSCCGVHLGAGALLGSDSLGADGEFSTSKGSHRGKPGSANIPASRADLPPQRRALYDSLTTLRLELAQSQRLPAFVIFTDRTLLDMCARLPRTETQFLEVSGVGSEKARRYGDRFLPVIEAFCRQNDSSGE